jgi:hypothetical protein
VENEAGKLIKVIVTAVGDTSGGVKETTSDSDADKSSSVISKEVKTYFIFDLLCHNIKCYF